MSARVYAVVTDLASRKEKGDARSSSVEVVSPQMGETRHYVFSVGRDGTAKLERSDSMGINPYVEACVRESMGVNPKP